MQYLEIHQPKKLQLTYREAADVCVKSKRNQGKVNSNEYARGIEIQSNIKGSKGQRRNQCPAGVRAAKMAILMNTMNKNNSSCGISVFGGGNGNLLMYKRQENPITVAALHLGESHTIGR